MAPLGVAYTSAGRREDAERIDALLPRPVEQAQARTFEALDRMAPLGPIRIGKDVLIRPEFALLRGDPRLKALRRKVGLPE